MNEIFGLQTRDLMYGVIVAVVIVVGITTVAAVRNPLLFRMGIRNLPRRRAQTLLIVLGLMLSTVIIASAFTTGDTLSSSLRNTAFQITGRIDHLVQFDTDAGRSVTARDAVVPEAIAAEIETAFADDPDIEGFARSLFDVVSMFNTRTQQLEPFSFLLGLVPEEVDAIDGIPALGGGRLQLSDLTDGTMILNRSAARGLAAEVGDPIAILALGQEYTFTVVAIAEDTLVSGEVNPAEAQGGVIHLNDAQRIFDQPDRMSGIGVAVRGGVEGALERSEAVDERLNEYLRARAREEHEANLPADERVWADAQGRRIYDSEPFKQDAVDNAELFGSLFTTLFLVMGLFSMAAGVLLIFLIFVLLAEERKPEMGIARAVGMQRSHLLQSYVMEGLAYNAGSAIVGTTLGVLVAFGMVEILNSSLGEEFGFTFVREVTVRSLIISAGAGIVLTFLTVAVSAFRVSHLNIVAAIRDLPETGLTKRRPLSAVGILTAILGMILFLPSIPLMAIGALIVAVRGREAVFGSRARWLLFPATELIRTRDGAGIATTLVGLLLVWLTPIAALVGGLLLMLPGVGGAIRRRGWGEWVLLPFWTLMRWRPEWWFVLLIGGIQFALQGISGEVAFFYLMGLSLLPAAVLLLIRRFRDPGRATYSMLGALLLLIWLSPLEWHIDATGVEFNVGGPEMFVLSGVMMVTGATIMVVYNLSFLVQGMWLLSRPFGRLRPVVQTAAAYPTTARYRTGMTVAMIAIIMFALVTFTTINANFSRLFTGDAAAGGYDIQADANRNQPFENLTTGLADADASDLAGRLEGVSRLRIASTLGTDIVSVATQAWDDLNDAPVRDASGDLIAEPLAVDRIDAAFDADGTLLPDAADDPALFIYEQAFLAGADDAFLAENGVQLQSRALGFASDAAVWEAVRTGGPNGERYAVVSALAVDQPGQIGVDDDAFVLPDTIDVDSDDIPTVNVVMRNPANGEALEVTIIGIVEQIVSVVVPTGGVFLPVVITSDADLDRLYDDVDLRRHLARVAPGEEPLEVAQAIEATLRVQTVSIIDELEEQQELFSAILLLFQGFTGLGLFAGIAALGVIAIRSVVERRQQIGVMRAIGFRAGMVRAELLLEMSFIAVLGIVTGMTLAIVLAWRLFEGGVFGSTAGEPFFVPITEIGTFALIAIVASLAMTALPARQAARVPVAEALRYE